MTKNVVIIGCGRIGALFDEPDDQNFLTHAHCVTSISNFKLLGFYDTHKLRAVNAAKKWGGEVFQSFDDFGHFNVDIFVIASPTSTHADLISRLCKFRPTAIICDKPLAANVTDARRTNDQCTRHGIQLFVCYQRRHCTKLKPVITAFSRGQYGNFISGNVIYSKGFINNGSHAIDLCQQVLGDLLRIKVISQRDDCLGNDLTETSICDFSSGCVHFIGCDERFYSIWELDLRFEKGRMRLVDGGDSLLISAIAKDPKYPGFLALNERTKIEGVMSGALYDFYDAVLSAIEKRETGNLGLEAHLSFLEKYEERSYVG